MKSPSTPASRALIQLRIAAGIISISWLAMALAIQFEWIGLWDWLPYTLGASSVPLPIQLVTFSFIHAPGPWFYWTWDLLVHLLWLWGLVNIVAGRLNLIGCVRIYSLGTIGAGALWLLVANRAAWFWRPGEPGVIVGVFIGAMAAFAPRDQVFIWGERVKRVISNAGKSLARAAKPDIKPGEGCLAMILACLLPIFGLLAVEFLLQSPRSVAWLRATPLLPAVCPFAWLVVACLPCRLWVVATIWMGQEVVRDLLVLARDGEPPAMRLAMTALAVGAGAAYGGVERWWRQKPDRWKS